VPSSAIVAPGDVVGIDVVLETGDQPVDGADIYLDFDPTYLTVVDQTGSPVTAISPDPVFPQLIQNSVDNTLGHINYSAGALTGPRPSGTITVARFYVSPKRLTSLGWTQISFSRQVPRQTDVAYQGESVLGVTEDGRVLAPSLRLFLPSVLKNFARPLPPAGR
jgi:hypothetical protein